MNTLHGSLVPHAVSLGSDSALSISDKTEIEGKIVQHPLLPKEK